MVDKFDIIVPIKEELKKRLVFGIKARLAIGHILRFYDFIHKVNSIMQVLSHSTRAYIINADGLPGFLVKADLMPFANFKALPVAITLSYYGDREQVYDLMQKCSHKTRAYIVNAPGLRGFLIPTVIAMIRRIRSGSEFINIAKY